MADVAGRWASMRDSVARGELPAGMDISDQLIDAVGLVMRARDQGVPVKTLIDQAAMFNGPDEITKMIARAMFTNEQLKRGVSRKRLSQFLSDYADEAMKNEAGPRLIGEPLEAEDVLKTAIARTGREDLFNAAEEALTPERIEEIADAPETQTAVIMEAERLRLENARAESGDFYAELDRLREVARDRKYDPAEAAVVEKADGFSDPVVMVQQYAGREAELDAAIDAGRQAVRAHERVLIQKYGVKTVDDLDDAPLTESERAFLFHSDIPEPRELADMRRIIEPVETLDEAASELRRTIADLPEPDSEAGLFAEKTAEARLLFLGREIERLGGDPREVIEQAAEGWAQRLDDAEDIEVMVRRDLGRLMRYFDPKTPQKSAPLMIDMDDGLGPRSLDDIMEEADDEIAAAKELEGCAAGMEPA